MGNPWRWTWDKPRPPSTADSEARLIAIELECASKHLSKELLKAHTSKEDTPQ